MTWTEKFPASPQLFYQSACKVIECRSNKEEGFTTAEIWIGCTWRIPKDNECAQDIIERWVGFACGCCYLKWNNARAAHTYTHTCSYGCSLSVSAFDFYLCVLLSPCSDPLHCALLVSQFNMQTPLGIGRARTPLYIMCAPSNSQVRNAKAHVLRCMFNFFLTAHAERLNRLVKSDRIAFKWLLLIGSLLRYHPYAKIIFH